MKKIMLISLVLLVAVLAGGCASYYVAEVRGPLPKANEVYVGETIVIHEGKPATEEYALPIINAYKESIREYLPEYEFKVVDKPGSNTLVLKTTIKDAFYFMFGFYTGGRVEVLIEVYQNSSLLPITLKAASDVSKFNRGTFNGTSYSGTAYVIRKHFGKVALAEKLKEHFNP